MEPFAQGFRGSKVFEPMVDAGGFFGYSARPQTVDQHTLAVRERGFLISAFDFDRHQKTAVYQGPRGFQNAALQT